MKTKAVRLYGKNDLRLEAFELPPIHENEILAKVICDSICMSSYKAVHEADIHKRVPRNVASNPVIIGHEFAGEIVEVGAKWKDRFETGNKFSIQPAFNDVRGPVGLLSAPGYSYPYIGGNATYIIVPNEAIENGCLMTYSGPGFYPASLSEPLSCVIGAMHANYHTDQGSYIHQMDIKHGGKMMILAGAGPMGLAAINYAVHRNDRKPKLLVITDIDIVKLERAKQLFLPDDFIKKGIELHYVLMDNIENPVEKLKKFSDGTGYDDVFVFAPVASVIEQGDELLAVDGCLNFFAGPPKTDFKAPLNFFNIHYARTHVVGTSGGNNNDMFEALEMMSQGLDPAGLVTHIGGINAVIDATLNLPAIPGGKKLIYNHIDMMLTAISAFEQKGKTDPVFAELHDICAENHGLWNLAAEDYLMKKFKI